MMGARELGIGSDVEPKTMHQFTILRAQSRGMRTEGVFANAAVRSVDLQNDAGAGFRQTLPGIAGKLGLLVSTELVGGAADDPTGTQPLRRYHDGFEHVSSTHYEKVNRLAFFFRHGHCRRE